MNETVKQANKRNFHFGALNLPIKAAENQRKKILKFNHPIDAKFSDRIATFFDIETLCTKVNPKLHMEKQRRIEKQALLRDDLEFLPNINMAR